MLITLIAWIYCTLICWAWGMAVAKLLQPAAEKMPVYTIPVVCFFGLSALAIIAGYLSLFMPLNSLLVQAFILLPALFFFLHRRTYRSFTSEILSKLKSLSLALVLMLVVSIGLILLMSVWFITHPDTLGYHAQTIRWIEDYKVIPGLANLHVRYGYQGLWFPLCALFNLQKAGISQPAFINGVVLLWFLLFVVQQANTSIKQQRFFPALLWLLLIAQSMWSYTQVRLTASSASPDFIAALYCWIICYLFVSRNENLNLIFFLSIAAVTIKLSIAPVLLYAVFVSAQYGVLKKFKQLALLLFLAVILALPYASRNVITSGYIAFPSPAFDLFKADWKYDKTKAANEVAYIKAYARTTAVSRAPEKTSAVNNQTLQQWVPQWWREASIADKTILAVLLLAMATSLLFIKRLVRQMDPRTTIALLISLTGVVFWFVNAPAPRFGFGFIISSTGLLLYEVLKNFKQQPGRRFLLYTCLVLSGIIFAYDGYRVLHFLTPKQLLVPAGIAPVPYEKGNCNGEWFYIKKKDFDCGNTPVPCAGDCRNFILRGKDLNDGFLPKQ